MRFEHEDEKLLAILLVMSGLSIIGLMTIITGIGYIITQTLKYFL